MKLARLKASTQATGGQASEQAERINDLEAEVTRLQGEVEAARKLRDKDVAAAAGVAEQATQVRADVSFGRLWKRMQQKIQRSVMPKP